MYELNVYLLLATGLVAILTYIIKDSGSKFTIRYPKVQKRAKQIFIPLSIIVFILTVWCTVDSNNENTDTKSDLKNNFDSVKTELKHSVEKSDSIFTALRLVKRNAERTDSLLLPFLLTATTKYPKLDSIKALKKLYGDININIKSETINAANAQIATIGQKGDNYLVSNISDAKISCKWSEIDAEVTSVGKEKLPTKKLQYNRLYQHTFELDYFSQFNRNEVKVIIHNYDVVHHIMSSFPGGFLIASGNGIIETPIEMRGLYLVKLRTPINGTYKITIYTTTKVTTKPKVSVYT